MGFINNLFGGSDNGIIAGILALAIVIILIVFGVWVLKILLELFGNVSRGQAKRLAIIETLALDQRRQLIIVKRDNVEHLILTGGANEIVIESNILKTTTPNVTQKSKNAKEMQNIKKRIKTALEKNPVVEPVLGAVSLRHSGLLRRKNDEENIINPQTFDDNELNDETKNADSAINYFERNAKTDKSGNDGSKGNKK